MKDLRLPRRLIEVDLPIRRISEQARREKSIRHGHISTLHIWWARRPLAACRAVILAALWPDPADENCPPRFLEAARERMQAFFAGRDSKPRKWKDPLAVRTALLDFIAEFSNWDRSNDPLFIETARDLVQVAHESLGGEPGTRPLVVDPFAGGGSIPLEALRVGADAFASDLNPVAVLLNKVVLEYIPRYGKRLAEEVRKWGEWVKKEAEKELAPYYPHDPDGATPIAYLWARTIRCEGPGCGAEVPLIRSLWLGKKPKRPVALRIVPDPKKKRVEFEIVQGVKEKDVGEGTVRRGSATCPVCGYTTKVDKVRAQLRERRGGAHDARMLCVVTTKPGQEGRSYRLPTKRDLDGVREAAQELERRMAEPNGGLSIVPDEEISLDALRRVQVPNYGMTRWGYLFTPRQALALTTMVDLVNRADAGEQGDELKAASRAILGLSVGRLADRSCTGCRWAPQPDQEKIQNAFGRQALPITWDFAEGSPLTEGTAGWRDAYLPPARIADSQPEALSQGEARTASATASPLPDGAAAALITDPPYYDAVTYAFLSDFFYVWLRRALQSTHPGLFATPQVPKEAEIIVDPPHRLSRSRKDVAFYERELTRAFCEARRIVRPDGVATVVFASKTTASWEAVLGAVVGSGWVITASWPIDTERANRLAAQGQARLASSIHLVCRPRCEAEPGDWRDVLLELPKRIHDWMPRLAEEGVVGADAIFACLGPALEVYSKYDRVERPSGEVVTLREYLEHVWAAVAKEALSLVFEGADASGFEEDARLTAMWLWTLSAAAASANGGEPDEEDEHEDDAPARKEKVKGYALEYDAARKIAQGLGAHLEDLSTLVEVKGETARLLPVAERTRVLFGKKVEPGGSRKPNKKLEKQLSFVDEVQEAETAGGWGETGAPSTGKTVLDRLHQAMILFAAGRGEALRRFVVEDGVGRDERLWRLGQALSALYPTKSEEKRWVDGVLARKKSFGF